MLSLFLLNKKWLKQRLAARGHAVHPSVYFLLQLSHIQRRWRKRTKIPACTWCPLELLAVRNHWASRSLKHRNKHNKYKSPPSSQKLEQHFHSISQSDGPAWSSDVQKPQGFCTPLLTDAQRASVWLKWKPIKGRARLKETVKAEGEQF